MNKRTIRTILDALLTIMIVAEMFIQYTGVFLHEVIGFAFFISLLIHIGLSLSWISSAASSASEGTLNGRRKALAIMGILLASMMVVLGTSSVAISTILASTGFVWPIGSYDFWSVLHTISSYSLSALVVVHLGMHWGFIAKVMNVPYNPARRQAIGASVNTVAVVGAAALGIAGAREAFADSVEAASRMLESETASGTGTTAEANAVASRAQVAEQTYVHKGHHSKRKHAAEDTTSQTTSNDAQDNAALSTETEQTQAQPEEQTYESYKAESYQEPSYEETYQYEPEATYEAYSYDEGNSGSSASGICTLCRKSCSLSAPQCSRPYQAGLI